MLVPAKFEPRVRSGSRRAAIRRSLRLVSVLGGSKDVAIIHDLSLTGLLIETSTELVSGEEFSVEIPECGQVPATVVWNSGRFFGCKFAAPIPAAAISAARLRDSSNFTQTAKSGATLGAGRNVYVVDEDDGQRRSLVDFNQARGMQPRPFASVEEFLTEVGRLKPGCVILGKLTPSHVPGVVHAISDKLRPLPTIMIAAPASVVSAIKSAKPATSDVLEFPFDESAVYGLLSGLFADLERDLLLSSAISAARKSAETLTGREREILRGLVGGLANKAIADELGLNVRTVEMHRANMMRRLDVRSLSAALRIAFYAKITPLSLKDKRAKTILVVPTK